MQASAIELAHIAERSRKCQEIKLVLIAERSRKCQEIKFALITEPQPILCKDKHNKAMCRVFTLPAMFFVGRIRQSFPLWAQR